MNDEIPQDALDAMTAFMVSCPSGYCKYLNWLSSNAAFISDIGSLAPSMKSAWQISLLFQSCWLRGGYETSSF